MEDTKAKKINVELYTRYKTFSWDLLFYYAIIYLFFTETKGISAADVLLAESTYPIFKMLFLIPATVLINSLGKRMSLIIGNSFVAVAIFTYILGNNFWFIVLGELLSAIGFIIKGVCESNILYDSLEKNEKRGVFFARIEGKGTSYYYYIDAISSVIAGILFAINGYIPMVLCLLTTIFSIYLASKFQDIDKREKIDLKTVKDDLIDLKNSYKLFSKSPRLKNLLFFGALISGILLSVTMLRSGIMQEVGIPSGYFGLIFAIMGLISGISARNEHRFHKKYRNKTLGKLALPLVISFIILGIICGSGAVYGIKVITVLIVFLVQYIVKGPFYPLIKQYLNNFTTTKLRTKISSSFNLLENILRFVITFVASILLRVTTTSNTFTILGCVLTLVVVLTLDNMRTKVGLKPEEYTEKDTNIMNLRWYLCLLTVTLKKIADFWKKTLTYFKFIYKIY